MSASPARPRWVSIALYAPVVALYVLAFPYHPGLRSPNELCRLWQTRAIADYGELEINAVIRDHGYVGDLSVKDGRYYPSKAPLLSVAAVPVYEVLSAVGGGGKQAVPELPLIYWHRLFLTVLPTLLMLVLVRRFLGAYLSPLLADGLTVTYALGTLAFSYSLLFMSHQPTAVLAFAAFYVLWRALREAPATAPLDRARVLRFVGAGALCGLTVAAEYTGALAVAGVVLYGVLAVLRDNGAPLRARLDRLGTALALATVGALPFVLGLMAYHQAVFGHPLHSGYKYLNDAAYQGWHVGGFLGIRYPDPRAFALSFFSPLRGLFALSPVLLLAIPGVLSLRRLREGGDRALFPSTVVLLLAYAYFTSSFSYESWGWTTGPRHLTALVPFLLLPLGLWVQSMHARAENKGSARVLAGVGAGLGAASVIATGMPTFVNYIPDSVSNPLFALAIPLLREGYPPPSLPGLLTGAHVFFGWKLVALLLVAAVAVFIALLPRTAAPGTPTHGTTVAAGFGVITLALFLGLLALSTEHDRDDEGARKHLRSVWLVAPGRSPQFWP